MNSVSIGCSSNGVRIQQSSEVSISLAPINLASAIPSARGRDEQLLFLDCLTLNPYIVLINSYPKPALEMSTRIKKIACKGLEISHL